MNKNKMFFNKIQKNKQGVILPIALLLLFLSTGLILSSYNIIKDYIVANNNLNLVSFTEREAENALIYGIYDSNAIAIGRCPDFNNEKEITNIDGGITTTIDGYKVKRFYIYNQNKVFFFSPTTDSTKKTLVGKAKIYTSSGIKVSEKAVAMDIEYLTSDDNSPTTCNETAVIKMHKDTFRNVN